MPSTETIRDTFLERESLLLREALALQLWPNTIHKFVVFADLLVGNLLVPVFRLHFAAFSASFSQSYQSCSLP